MKLTELKINEFVDLMASDAPAPGGGSAAALCGALGISLTNMVASLTVGKDKYKESEEIMQEIISQAKSVKLAIVEAIDRDTEAFNGVTAVFKMPKETDDDKLARKEAMQVALKESTKVPFEIMILALSALEISEKALGKFNVNCGSDLGVAALTLKTAVQGAWLNVLINLPGISDAKFKEEYKTNGENIIKKALPLADKIYDEILKSL